MTDRGDDPPMNEERSAILRMLEEGTISVDEATALLDAIEPNGPLDSIRSGGIKPPPADNRSSAQAVRSGNAEASFSEISLDRMTEMKVHGVTPDFIKKMNAL